jgi:hypothetical protein
VWKGCELPNWDKAVIIQKDGLAFARNHPFVYLQAIKSLSIRSQYLFCMAGSVAM